MGEARELHPIAGQSNVELVARYRLAEDIAEGAIREMRRIMEEFKSRGVTEEPTDGGAA